MTDIINLHDDFPVELFADRFYGIGQGDERLAFISTPVANAEARERKAGEIARAQGWRFEKLPGDLGWLRRLVDGDWNEKEFLTLQPGQRVALRYDEQVIGAEWV